MKKDSFLYRFFVIICVLLLIILPILFFYYKNKNKSHQESANNIADISLLEKNYVLSPTAVNAINLSLAYINNNMPGKADYLLQKFVKKDSSNVIVYNNLGVANILLKNYKFGINACKKAIQLDSTFTLAKNNLNWGLLEVAGVRKNIDSLKNKVSKVNKEEKIHLKLGLCYLQIGEFDSSIVIFEKAKLIYPKDDTYPINIGTALMMKKEYEKALVKFNEALSINPSSQLAINNINWAKQEIEENKK